MTAGGDSLPERPRYLAMLAFAPALWVLHFVLSYGTAAIWCSRWVGPGGSLEGAREAIVWYTIAALLGIVLVGWSAYQRWRRDSKAPPHDADTAEARHQFLAYATLLLAGLSAVATIYVAVSAMFFRKCL